MGLARLQLILAALIFLPAGTIHYWQAWLFWVVFFACVVWITFHFLKTDPHLIENRMTAGPRAEQEKSQKIIQAITGALAAALVIVPALDFRFHGASVPTPIVLLADALVVASFIMIARVFRENSFAASTIKVEPGQRVISTGPYAIVRHPMYTAGSIGILAAPLTLGSWWGLLVGCAMVAGIIARLLDEERYLSANLPGYDAYRGKVKYRLVPMVW